MGFLRSKASYIVIAIMLVLCIAAVVISVNISLVMYKKQEYIVKDKPTEQPKKIEAAAKPVDLRKIGESELYLNGRKVDGLNAYMSDDNKLFLPVDVLFPAIGSRYSYFNPDDLVEVSINNDKLLFKLGSDSFLLNKVEIPLETPPLTAMDHILIPAEVLSHLGGFTADSSTGAGTVFLNYNPDFNLGDYAGIQVLRLVDGVAGITDLKGDKLLWDRGDKVNEREVVQFSGNMASFVLKNNSGVSAVKLDEKITLVTLQAPLSSILSADGRYLYWIERSGRTSYICNIQTGAVKELGDQCFRIGLDDQEPGAVSMNDSEPDKWLLYDYAAGRSFKRVVFTDESQSELYFFIERNGKTVVEGRGEFSPDRQKVLYYQNGKCHVSYADGSGAVLLAGTVNARWVNNNSIFVDTGEGMFLYSRNGKTRREVDREWRMVGETAAGAIFYTGGNTLYCVSGKEEKKLADLSQQCDSVYALSAQGPYLTVSAGEDIIYFIKGEELIGAGSRSLLPGVQNEDLKERRMSGMAISPDNRYFCVLQQDNSILSINVITAEDASMRNVVLDCWKETDAKPGKVGVKWLSGSKLLVYTSQKGWIVSLDKQVEIFQWTEPQGSSIEGVLTEE